MKVYVILSLGFGDDEDAEQVYGVRLKSPEKEVEKLNSDADADLGTRLDGQSHYRYEEHMAV